MPVYVRRILLEANEGSQLKRKYLELVSSEWVWRTNSSLPQSLSSPTRNFQCNNYHFPQRLFSWNSGANVQWPHWYDIHPNSYQLVITYTCHSPDCVALRILRILNLLFQLYLQVNCYLSYHLNIITESFNCVSVSVSESYIIAYSMLNDTAEKWTI